MRADRHWSVPVSISRAAPRVLETNLVRCRRPRVDQGVDDDVGRQDQEGLCVYFCDFVRLPRRIQELPGHGQRHHLRLAAAGCGMSDKRSRRTEGHRASNVKMMIVHRARKIVHSNHWLVSACHVGRHTRVDQRKALAVIGRFPQAKPAPSRTFT